MNALGFRRDGLRTRRAGYVLLAAATVIGWLAVAPFPLRADVRVIAERNDTGTPFKFKSVPPPAVNDAAAKARFTVVDGQADPNGSDLSILHDGQVPTEEDQPAANFFFRAGTDGGRILIDLERNVSIQQISTYSWHSGARAPQVYTVYGASATSEHLNTTPARPIAPESVGWVRIGSVDTRVKETEAGGQTGVQMMDAEKPVLIECRYLLFDLFRTENADPFGNTFFSEIDVIDAAGPAPIPISATEQKPVLASFDAADGKFHFTIDATAAPDLMDWAQKDLRPVVEKWYPKLVEMLPSEGFQARTNVTLRFRNDMGGTPASAGGSGINLNSGWFRKELNREARGSVVHEMVHVVQSYGRVRRTLPNATRTPGWLVEGMADYIRWFLYEPETRGAEITARNLARAKYDASYRVTGNFLNWATQKYDTSLVRKLNAAARNGEYRDDLWKEWTGQTVQQLGEEWLQAQRTRLDQGKQP